LRCPLPFFREQNRSGVVMYSHAGPVSFPFSFFPGDPKYPKNPKNLKSEFENFSLRISIFGKPILAAGSDFNISSGFLQIIDMLKPPAMLGRTE